MQSWIYATMIEFFIVGLILVATIEFINKLKR